MVGLDVHLPAASGVLDRLVAAAGCGVLLGRVLLGGLVLAHEEILPVGDMMLEYPLSPGGHRGSDQTEGSPALEWGGAAVAG